MPPSPAPLPTEMENPPPSRRRGRLTAGIFFLVALVGFLIFQEIQRPWEGPVGRRIYGDETHRDEVREKWAGALRVMATKGASSAKAMDTDSWRVVGLWTGGIIFTAGALLLAAGAPWWSRWSALPERRTNSMPRLPPPGRSWLWLAAALLLATIIRTPYLDGAILWDEQDNLRRNYHGTFRWDEPGGEPVWQPAGAADAFWENRRGNNPHFHSLLAWSANRLWATATGAPTGQYNIVAVRLPAYLAALAALPALWWFLRVAGLGRIAGPACLLAAAHPLWSQYGIESRGYGLTLLLTPLLLAGAWRFLRGAAWRDAILLAASSLLLLVSYPGSFYVVVFVQLAVVALLARAGAAGDRLAMATRWFVANACAGLIFLWVMAPILPQTAGVMENSFQRGEMPAYWFAMAHHLYATGMQLHFSMDVFFNSAPDAPTAAGWLAGDYWRMGPLAPWSLLVFPGLGIAGLFRWWKTGHRTVFVLVVATLAAGVACASHHALVTGCFIYPWYMIFMLPGLLAACASGLDAVADRLPRADRVLPALAAVSALFLVLVSHPAVVGEGWRSHHALCSSRPAIGRWDAPGRTGARVEFKRGSSLWINYREGYQIHIPAYTGREAIWSGHLDHPPVIPPTRTGG